MKNKTQKLWKYVSNDITAKKEYEDIKKIVKNDLLAKLLISRKVDTVKKVKDYLEPLKMEYTSPFDFTDMNLAVERILKAVENQEFILVNGDFDADGITSTALLSKLLTFLKANFEIYIPNREKESHGLCLKKILQYRAKKKLKLLISCDCGISNVKEVETIKSLGVETIITDHHEPSDVLPDAIAIINPKVEGKLNEELDTDKIKYLSDLAGVGVAFKLALGILEKIGQQEFSNELLPLVAVGTIADVVPLFGENRGFVILGLDEISKNKNLGITELLKISGVDISKGVKADDIAFQIAPRLNASGRLDTADEAYKILVAEGKQEVEFLCQELNNKNLMRQAYCDKIFKEALEMYEKSDFKDEDIIVLYKEDWHMGVIGIVASKMVEKYHKPTLLMCKNANEDIIRSSARSIDGIDIHELLSELKDYFENFGGHKGAAGLSFNMKKYSFSQIQKLIFETAKKYTSDVDLTPILKVDMKVEPDDLTFEFLDSLSALEPCGAGNNYPVFVIENLKLQEQKLIGQKQNHLKFICSDKDNNTLDCVFWSHPLLKLEQNSNIDIAFCPKKNEFNNNITLQLDIKDAHYEIVPDVRIYDHRQKKDILPLVCDFVTKNVEKIYIYINDKKLKENLLNAGFPMSAFVSKNEVSHLMFFDYPESVLLMKKVIEKYNPKNLHLMRCNLENVTIIEFLSKILGMIKYACNNKNGEIDVELLANTLKVNNEIIVMAIELLFDVEAIKRKNISYEPKLIYTIDYEKSVSLDVIKQEEKFLELQNLLNNMQNFKNKIMTLEEKELSEILL